GGWGGGGWRGGGGAWEGGGAGKRWIRRRSGRFTSGVPTPRLRETHGRDAVGHRGSDLAGSDRRGDRDRAGVVHEPVDTRDVPRRTREHRRVVLFHRQGCIRPRGRLLLALARARL